MTLFKLLAFATCSSLPPPPSPTITGPFAVLSTTRSIAPFKTPWLCSRPNRRSGPRASPPTPAASFNSTLFRSANTPSVSPVKASRKLRKMSSSSRDLCRWFIFSCRSPWRTKRSSSPTRPPSSPPTASLPLRSSAVSTSSALPEPTAPTAWR